MISPASYLLAAAAHSAPAGDAGMLGKLAHQFGVQWVSFIAQVVVVLIVYTILKRFAFGPVTQILEQRRQRIIEAEANADKTKAALANAQAEASDIVANANAQADRLIKEAQQAAQAAGEKKTQEAIAEATAIIEKAREASRIEHERAMGELKRDFGRLVADATGKVTGKILSPDDHQKINQEAVTQLAA